MSFGIVGDDREAHGDRAGAAGDGHIVYGSVGVDKREDALKGVLVHLLVAVGLDVAEDHGCPDYQRDDVAYRPQVGTYRNHTNGEAQV